MNYYNFQYVADQLHMTRQGARALILRNKTKLKKYLVLDKKNVVGITNDDGIEAIRNLRVKNYNTLSKKISQVDLLQREIDLLNQQIELLKNDIVLRDNLLNELKATNTKLDAELSYYRDSGFFQRLLGYRKK